MTNSSSPTGRFTFSVADDAWEWDDDVYLIHGLEPQSVRPTTEFILRSKHPDDLGHVREVLDGALRDGGSFAVSYRLIRADGTERQVVLTGYGQPAGSPIEVLEGYYIDLTADFDEQIRLGSDKAIDAVLGSRAIIEQAKGALILAYGINADAAFAMLIWWSKNHNVKIRDLAHRLIEAAQGRPVIARSKESLDRLLFDLTSDWTDTSEIGA